MIRAIAIIRTTVANCTLGFQNEWDTLNRDSEEANGFIEVVLDHFTIYKPQSSLTKSTMQVSDFEMTTLQDFQTLDRKSPPHLLLDGILIMDISNTEIRREVRKVPFEIVSVEGYGDLEDPAVTIWIQSLQATGFDIWYRLREPSPEYRRYFEPFLWIANFGKHVVDFFCQSDLLKHSCVPRLEDFKEHFSKWLDKTYEQSKAYRHWMAQYNGKRDFRIPLVAYQQYLWKEFAGVDRRLQKLEIFNEISPLGGSPVWTAVPWQKTKDLGTVVTPYVYSCFSSMYFASAMQEVQPSLDVCHAQNSRASVLGFTPFELDVLTPAINVAGVHHKRCREVRIGDVIATSKDPDSKWKDNAAAWYGYVHNVMVGREGLFVRVLWLSAPEHTTLGNAAYPFSNELFLSDQCNCGESLAHRDILGTVDVAWCPVRIEGNQKRFFVRQQYCVEDDNFVTLRTDDETQFTCRCKKEQNRSEGTAMDNKVGDTVLIKQGSTLEPVIITDILDRERCLKVRKLVRRQRDLNKLAKPNELAWTNKSITVSPQAVQRRCYIRFYTTDQIRAGQVPKPYSLDGQCDCWIICTRLVNADGQAYEEELSEPFPASMKVAFNPEEQKVPPLRTLSLFSGAGGLDFGLEDSGAMSVDFHVEWDVNAVHTIRANSPTQTSQIFYGSVDDSIYEAMIGKKSPGVPLIGQVEAIAAGSPCQGFSTLQNDALSDQSLRNASKIASVAAYIDLYRPIYAVLENVPSMATKEINGQNVFQRLLCALVGLGYQVSQFSLNAWTMGAPTKRSRLFIVITAPGYTPPQHPPLTHSSPPKTTLRSLGSLSNGKRFGVSKDDITPFEFVSVRNATADLPGLGDGHVGVCIPHPDHRPNFLVRLRDRLLIQAIPTHPAGMGIAQTLLSGIDVPQPVRDYWNGLNPIRLREDSHSWCRIDAAGLFPTITTKLVPSDCRNGFGVHWDEDRVWTVMEARRAHGIPDDFVLVGNPVQQWRQIGNGVARPVALALGMVIRRAWLANSAEMVESSRRSAGLEVYEELEKREALRARITVPVNPLTREQRRRYVVIDSEDEAGS